MEGAILLANSIRYWKSFQILRRHNGGVVVGVHGDGDYIAIHQAILKTSTTLRPVVGKFAATPSMGWIFPETDLGTQLFSEWTRALALIPLLEWRKRLRAHIRHEAEIKLAIEDYSVDDVVTLRDNGWFVGRNAHAPLWRLYAVIPMEVYEGREFPHFDGMMRSINRFGAIYDPRRHRIVVKT